MTQRDSKGRFSKTEGRPFKVGDRVRGYTEIGGRWKEGVITNITLWDPCQTYELGFANWISRRHKVTLLEPAPQPKAEDPKDAEIAALKAEVERLKEEAAHATYLERRAESSEAKLADIKAIIRTFKLLRGANIGSLEEAVGHALGDAA